MDAFYKKTLNPLHRRRSAGILCSPAGIALTLAIGLTLTTEPAAAGNPAQSPAAPLSTGTLKVVGEMFDTNGALFLLPHGMASFSLSCSPAGPSYQNLALQNRSRPSYVVAGGSTCSVALQNENPMTPVAHYVGCAGASASWTKHYSAQQVVVPTGGTVTMTFTQRLSCDSIARQRADAPLPPQQ